jgi:hypothetical protein
MKERDTSIKLRVGPARIIKQEGPHSRSSEAENKQAIRDDGVPSFTSCSVPCTS